MSSLYSLPDSNSTNSHTNALFEAAVLNQLAMVLKNQEELKSRIAKLEQNSTLQSNCIHQPVTNLPTCTSNFQTITNSVLIKQFNDQDDTILYCNDSVKYQPSNGSMKKLRGCALSKVPPGSYEHPFQTGSYSSHPSKPFKISTQQPPVISQPENESSNQQKYFVPCVVSMEPLKFDFSFHHLQYVQGTSTSIPSFVKKLALEIFTEEEIMETNCYGTNRKRKFDRYRLGKIKKAVFDMYEIEVTEYYVAAMLNSN